MKWEQRMRHSRGYGVHSPFLYRVVREAMMPRKIVGTERQLYNELIGAGTSTRTATRLQNYVQHVGHTHWNINSITDKAEGTLFVATTRCTSEILGEMMRACQSESRAISTLCIVHNGKKQSKSLCRELVAQHNGMSAEKPRFTLLFFNPALPKQHIVI